MTHQDQGRTVSPSVRRERVKFGFRHKMEPPSYDDAVEENVTQPRVFGGGVNRGLQRSMSVSVQHEGGRPVVRRRNMAHQEEDSDDYSSSEQSFPGIIEGNHSQQPRVERGDIAVHAGPGRTYFPNPRAPTLQSSMRSISGRRDRQGAYGASRGQEVHFRSDVVSPSHSDYGTGSENSGRIRSDNAEFGPVNGPTLKLLTPDVATFGKTFDFPTSRKEDPTVKLQEIGEYLRKILPPVSYRDDVDICVPHCDAYNSIWIWMCYPGHTARLQDAMKEHAKCLEKIFIASPVVNDLLEQQFVIAFSAERKRHCRGRVYRISSDQRTARVHLIDYGSIDIIPVQDIVVMPDWVEDSVAPIARRSRMREIDYGFEPADPEAFKDTFSTVVNSRMLRGRILRDDFEGEFLDIELEFGPYYRPAGRFLQMMGFQRSLLVLPPRSGKLQLLPESRISVRLMGIESASLFYCWPGHEKDTRDEIRFMSSCMTKTFENTPEPPTIPEMGVLVAVQNEGLWYRGRVVGVNYDYTCSIYFLDFGRTGVTTFASVRPLDEQNAETPAFALRCREFPVFNSELDLQTNSLDAARKLLLPQIGKQLEITILQFIPADPELVRGSDEDSADVQLRLPDGTQFRDALKNTLHE